ncbi:MAG: hypothetical protein ACI8TQ_002862 [Planctomycetota bacterium]|jgi:hypothetical protein
MCGIPGIRTLKAVVYSVMSIEADLTRMLSELELPPEHHDLLEMFFRTTVSMVKDGAVAPALENLFENLYEFEIELSTETREAFAEMGRNAGVTPEFLAMLDG